MSPIPAAHVWSLPAVGTKRHVTVAGWALCSPKVGLGVGTGLSQAYVMSKAACKRCLVKTGGAQ